MKSNMTTLNRQVGNASITFPIHVVVLLAGPVYNHPCLCRFPLFCAIYQICYEGKPVEEFVSCLKNHPEHM